MLPQQPSSLHPYPYTSSASEHRDNHNETSKRDTSPVFSYQSGEADDELSASSMGPISLDSHSPPPPSYPGEDTRRTSKKELLGFYVYSFAAEVFVVCGLGAFIPITLEDLARASATAVLASDHSKPCRAQGIEVSSSSPTEPVHHGGTQCVFKLFGAEINTASFAMYTFSVSVLLQALLVVTMSGAADHGRYRKKLLLSFAAVGAVATMLFLPVTPGVYLFASLWAIVGNVCFGASFVLLNSFLPLLVRHHPVSSVIGSVDAGIVTRVSEDVSRCSFSPTTILPWWKVDSWCGTQHDIAPFTYINCFYIDKTLATNANGREAG